MTTVTPKELRIDRWLWFVRFYKTRTLAGAAVAGGHVRINGDRARPGQRVQAGDQLQIRKNQLAWDLEVSAIPARRGPASEAQRCYEESEASRLSREAAAAQLKTDRLQMPRTPGRPDKHTRRKLRQKNRGG